MFTGWRPVWVGSVGPPETQLFFFLALLEMIYVSWVFFPENLDKTDEVCAQIVGSLKFGILVLN